MDKSNSYCNGPANSGNSAYNGPLKDMVRHGWFCACHWCLNGHRG